MVLTDEKNLQIVFICEACLHNAPLSTANMSNVQLLELASCLELPSNTSILNKIS